MMINFSKKWDEIVDVYKNNVTKRIVADHPLDLFIGYSDSGSRLLKLRTERDVFNNSELPEFENINLIINNQKEGSELIIILLDNQLRDLFTAITHDLVNASAKVSSTEGAAEVFIQRLRRWANLLTERRTHGLSLSEQLGLLGELLSILEIINKNLLSTSAIISGWRGPNGDARDISLGKISAEVKSSLNTSKRILKISSLDQLDTEDRNLVILYKQFSKADSGLSLGTLISNIEAILKPLSADWTNLWRKLYLLGYDPNADYVNAFYTLVNSDLYLVAEDFPKITPASVSPAIKNVSYEIDCSMLKDFIIKEDDFEVMINGS